MEMKVTMAGSMTSQTSSKPKTSSAGRQQRKRNKSKPAALAPWPDQKLRQQMSEMEAACENLGKHAKNRDWEKRW
jgi:hypothetical protein